MWMGTRTRRLCLGPAAAAALAACGEPTPTPASACERFAEVPDEIAVGVPELVEASGLIASRRHAGVLWAHNDSGDVPRLFALGADGARRGEFILTGAPSGDLEDAASGPCPDGSGPCLWIADTGNNFRDRNDLGVYAVAEPPALGDTATEAWWHFPLVYPGGEAIDVEAMVLGGTPAQLMLVEKIDAERARVFAAPAPTLDGELLTPVVVGDFMSPGIAVTRGRMVTGADLHPAGDRLALRTYTGVFEYALPAVDDPASFLAAEPTVVVYGPLSEPQGETVAYAADGSALWTLSEDPTLAAAPPLHRFGCAEP